MLSMNYNYLLFTDLFPNFLKVIAIKKNFDLKCDAVIDYSKKYQSLLRLKILLTLIIIYLFPQKELCKKRRHFNKSKTVKL